MCHRLLEKKFRKDIEFETGLYYTMEGLAGFLGYPMAPQMSLAAAAVATSTPAAAAATAPPTQILPAANTYVSRPSPPEMLSAGASITPTTGILVTPRMIGSSELMESANQEGQQGFEMLESVLRGLHNSGGSEDFVTACWYPPYDEMQMIEQAFDASWMVSPVPVIHQVKHELDFQLQLPQSAYFDVIVCSIKTAGHFFLQQPTHNSFFNLDRLHDCMRDCYSKPSVPELPYPIARECYILRR